MDSLKTGALINECRKQKGLTQMDIARMLNISNRTVSKWENGDGFPDITFFPQLAEILGITTDELLAGERKTVEEEPLPQVAFEAVVPQKVKYYETVFRLHRNLKISEWCLIVLFVCYSFMLFAACLYNLSSVIIVCMVLFIVLLLFVLLFAARLQAILHIKSQNELNVGKIENSLFELKDKTINLKCGKTEHTYSLSDITGFYDKKNLYILRINNRAYTYITKDSFTVGTADDFASYIRGNMTVKKEKNFRSVFVIAGTIIISALSVMLATLMVIAYLTSEDYSYEQRINMNSSELSVLNDDDLCNTVYERIENKKYDKNEPLNEYQQVFYDVDNFYFYIGNSDFCQYLYDLEETDISGLLNALDRIGLYDLSHQLSDFIDDNDIEIMDFNSKVDYEMLHSKYPFDELDKSIKSNSDDIDNALLTFVRDNIEYF